MRVDCPTCAAGYELPEALLRQGPRALRCAACGGTWTPALPMPEPAAASATSLTSSFSNFSATGAEGMRDGKK